MLSRGRERRFFYCLACICIAFLIANDALCACTSCVPCVCCWSFLVFENELAGKSVFILASFMFRLIELIVTLNLFGVNCLEPPYMTDCAEDGYFFMIPSLG